MTRHLFRIRLALVAIAAAFIATGGRADSLENMERILIPVMVRNVPGAFGSVWATELWFRNNSTELVDVANLGMPHWGPTGQGTYELPLGYFPAYQPGRFIYVTRERVNDVQFDLRLFNRSDTTSWGAKLPVVRVRDFKQQVSLINVPTAPDFRIALRIYGAGGEGLTGQQVALRVYPNVGSAPIATALIPFDSFLPSLIDPRYAQVLSLVELFPEVRSTDRIRLEVESLNPEIAIWAFLSVTSVTTQQVATVTPE